MRRETERSFAILNEVKDLVFGRKEWDLRDSSWSLS